MTSSGYDLFDSAGDHIPELQLPEAVLEEREELGSLQYFHESRTMVPPPGRTTSRPTGMRIMQSDEWRGMANVAIGENTRGFQSPREIAPSLTTAGGSTRDLDGGVPAFHRPIMRKRCPLDGNCRVRCVHVPHFAGWSVYQQVSSKVSSNMQQHNQVFSPQLIDSEITCRGPPISPPSRHRWSFVEQQMEEAKREICNREGARTSGMRGSPQEEGKERGKGGGKA